MPRNCTICFNRKRAEIDRSLMEKSDSIRQIAADFGVGYKSLQRHYKFHFVTQLNSDSASEQINQLKIEVETLQSELAELKQRFQYLSNLQNSNLDDNSKESAEMATDPDAERLAERKKLEALNTARRQQLELLGKQKSQGRFSYLRKRNR